MKITRIETIPVNVPLKPDLTTKTAHGEHVVSPYVVVKIHTDTEHIGLGEATLAPRWSGETSPGCVAVINGLFAPLLIGEDPSNIDFLRAKLNGAIKHNPFTKAAVEMALWDLAGKAKGVPVYELLGGRVRETIPMKMVVGGFDIPKATALARRFLDWGAKCLKVKVGIDDDFGRVSALREQAGSDIPIGVDANQGWDLETAKRMLAELEPLDILFAEQPVPGNDPSELAELRESTSIPVMADESVFTAADARQLTRHNAVDLLSVYPGKHGGIAATVEIAEIAKSAGIVCSMGSNLELGIGTAAQLHLGAAIETIASQRFPGDFLGPIYHEADLLTEPLQLGPDVAIAPDGPGLGIEVNDEQLERYRDSSQVAQSLG